MKLTKSEKEFQRVVKEYYKVNQRSLPWRKTKDPYRIWISEVMLQQTQVDRVLPKYQAFIKTYPTVNSLADASLQDVFMRFQGLGYNRRAKNLRDAAAMIVSDYAGVFPNEHLEKLPGVGTYTANAIRIFAFNETVPLIETNIRTVYIYFFFKNKDDITDTELLKKIEKTIDRDNPRDWFNALMDYGAMLKREVGNLNTKSKRYAKQSKFIGSDRELRGKILKLLNASRPLSAKNITLATREPEDRVKKILSALVKEGLLEKNKHTYALAP